MEVVDGICGYLLEFSVSIFIWFWDILLYSWGKEFTLIHPKKKKKNLFTLGFSYPETFSILGSAFYFSGSVNVTLSLSLSLSVYVFVFVFWV